MPYLDIKKLFSVTPSSIFLVLTQGFKSTNATLPYYVFLPLFLKHKNKLFFCFRYFRRIQRWIQFPPIFQRILSLKKEGLFSYASFKHLYDHATLNLDCSKQVQKHIRMRTQKSKYFYPYHTRKKTSFQHMQKKCKMAWYILLKLPFLKGDTALFHIFIFTVQQNITFSHRIFGITI